VDHVAGGLASRLLVVEDRQIRLGDALRIANLQHLPKGISGQNSTNSANAAQPSKLAQQGGRKFEDSANGILEAWRTAIYSFTKEA
jgi:hypothetical protein